MSVRDYKKEQEIEEINFIIADVRKVKKRLETIENDLIDLQNDKDKILHKM